MTQDVKMASVVVGGLLLLGVTYAGRYVIGLAVCVLFVAWLLWETSRKLTSDRAVDTSWIYHILSFYTAAVLIVLGAFAAASAAGFKPTIVIRVGGLISVIFGVVVLVAERRDFARWRSSLQCGVE